MRKIEQEMLAAINDRRDWIKDNTAVEIAQHIGNPYCIATVYLHGNLIAEIVHPEEVRTHDAPGMDWKAEADEQTVAEWPTNTTFSRLRALGIQGGREKGKPVIDGRVLA